MFLFKKVIKTVQRTICGWIGKNFIDYDRGLFINKVIKMVQCNICGWIGKRFFNLDCGYGHIYENSICPNCRSQPRHRSIYLYLKKVIPEKKLVKSLHFAPEKFLTNLIKSYENIDYLSVDIDPKKAMKKENITKLSFKDKSFDIILCIHVLEHIEDDRQAMSELFRVLTDEGFAVIDVPIDYEREKTYEDFTIKTPEERTKAFWQWDHVRLYGRDFSKRLEDVGFKVKADEFIESLGDDKATYFGLKKSPIYFCTKKL